MKKRRQEVGENLQRAIKRPRTETLAASEAASAGCWTESMQAEVDKQIVKKNVKKAIACEDDLLIPEETDADLHEAVKILQAQRDKTDRASANAERRLAHNNQVRQALSMSGWTVNVEKDCLDQTALLNRNIASKRMRRLGEISGSPGEICRQKVTRLGFAQNSFRQVLICRQKFTRLGIV